MSDYPGEIVTVRVVDPIDENDVPLDDSNASARISILSADQSVTYVNNAVMPWDPVAAKFSYGWDSTGRDPAEYLAKITVTPDGGNPGVEYRTLELAAPPTIAGWDRLTCSRWRNPEDFTLCGPDDFPAGVFDMVVDGATDLLFAASGRQFFGECSDTIRPVRRGGCWLPWDRYYDDSRLRVPGAVWLPGFPVGTVTEVKIEGVALDVGSWLIVDDRWLVRKAPESWPSFQALDRPDGDPETWTVSYTYVSNPPASGLLALETLVCELGKGWRNDSSCRLPKRLTSITREGFAAVVLDPFQFLNEGKFGVYEIDLFVNAVNPDHLSRDARVLNVDLLADMPHRVR